MSVRFETILWLAQRVSAGILAICVLVHLFTIVYATQVGLSGAEIVARLQGSMAWFGFYLLFLLSVSIHAPIGIRTVLLEHTRLSAGAINVLAMILILVLFGLGMESISLLFGGAR